MSSWQVISGSFSSSTKISKVQIVSFPYSSVAVNSMVVTPAGKAEPLAGPAVCTTVTSEHASVAVASSKCTTASQLPGSVFTVMSSGQSMVGRVDSVTDTVNVHVVELPAASTTSKVTSWSPAGTMSPDAGPSTRFHTTPGQLSSITGGS